MKFQSAEKLEEIEREMSILLKEDRDIETDIPEDEVRNFENTVSSQAFLKVLQRLSARDYKGKITYEDLIDIEDSVRAVAESLGSIKERVDVEFFLKDGYRIDKEKLKESYKRKGLAREYPDLDLDEFERLYINPPMWIPTYYDPSQKVLVDSYVFRKFLVVILQMIFNEMDFLGVYCGAEGTGKSVKVSQDMLTLHWILTRIKVISYPFEINEMFFNTIEKFQDREDKYFREKFRMLCLDEGNELNRQNWKEPQVQTFFQRLRRERFNQRLKFICIPVLGELLPAIVQSRVNFVFDGHMKNDMRTGELIKGFWNMIIIPRGEKVYSPYQKKDLLAVDIRQELHECLKDNNYRKGLDNKLIVKKFNSNGVWGFAKEEYKKNLKDSNEVFSVSKGLNITESEMYMFYKANITLRKVGVKPKDYRYPSLAKLVNRINNYFEKQPEILQRYEALYARKMAEGFEEGTEDGQAN